MDSDHSCLAGISLDSALKKDGNYSRQVFLKEYKYIQKETIRNINGNFSDISSSDESDESDEEYIKAIRINAEFWIGNIFIMMLANKMLYTLIE